MNNSLTHPKSLARIGGVSYWIIFFAAIFANFFALEALIQAPLKTVQQDAQFVSLGIMAFVITVVFDVVVAWMLQEMFKDQPLSFLSTAFRMMHATLMGVAIFALPLALKAQNAEAILYHVEMFNTLWLIGLFFFGIHLMLLGQMPGIPRVIALLLQIAGFMFMLDTTAHFMLPNYSAYASGFLILVATPSILGEMSFALWLFVKGDRA